MSVPVLVERPPNWDILNAAFGPLPRGVIFSWRDRIYNPDGVPMGPWLQAHEEVHCGRQGDSDVSLARWWDNYLSDATFRFQEELLAHREEYRVFCRYHADRNLRARYLFAISRRLSSPLYGLLCSQSEAQRLIRGDQEYEPRPFQL